MTTFKVRLLGSDGAEYTITYDGLLKKLKENMAFEESMGWNRVTKALRADLDTLRSVLHTELLIPKAKATIIQFLKDNPNVETRSFYHKAWYTGERALAWLKAKEELESEGVIVSESHGKGKNRTWNLKEC